MSLWGPLEQRYSNDAPRKLLALDGGGIRGIITLHILQEIESLLALKTGKGDAFRLCDFFDYIGGTSTGAIIAAGLARGMTVQELLSFYLNTGQQMFEKNELLKRLTSFYTADPLATQLKKVFGATTTLEPQFLRCLLLIVSKNVTTDSAWPVSSNPLAKYNQPDRPDCNLRIPLWQLVRASTAAPIYFPPEVLQWDRTDPRKTFVFVDGGVTPYNNPAFLLYRTATLPPYRLQWKKGEQNLLVVSVGTGSAANLLPDVNGEARFIPVTLAGLPGQLMYGIQVEQDLNCRAVGRCTYGAPIDREIGDLIPRDRNGELIPLSQDLGRDFLYARYNADLSPSGLKELGCGDIDAEKVAKLDSTEYMNELGRVGNAAAKQVRIEHFGMFV